MQDEDSVAHSAEENVEVSVLGRLSLVKGQTQAVWLDIHGEVWHLCFFFLSHS